MYAGQCRGHGYHSEHAAAKSGVAGDRLDELRKDPTRGHWVLIRPKAKPPRQADCANCPGAEHLTEPEIAAYRPRSEEHTSELQSLAYLVCRLLLEKKNTTSSSGCPAARSTGHLLTRSSC